MHKSVIFSVSESTRQVVNPEPVDKLEQGVRILQDLKSKKRPGSVTFHLDSNGMVVTVEVKQFIK